MCDTCRRKATLRESTTITTTKSLMCTLHDHKLVVCTSDKLKVGSEGPFDKSDGTLCEINGLNCV